MNFTTYDNTEVKKVNRSKTWINVKYKQIFSAEIKYNRFYQILDRFDLSTRETKYFIAFMNNKDSDNHSCRVDELGRTRFSIASIWNNFCPDIKNDTNIKLEYIESIEGADIFSIER